MSAHEPEEAATEMPTTHRRREWMDAHDSEWNEAISDRDAARARRLYEEFGDLLAQEMENTGGNPVLSLPLTNAILRERVRQLVGAKALDIGCGPTPVASMSLREAGFDVVAVDIAASILGVACRTSGGGIRFVLADAEQLPFADNLFDAITCDDTLEHAFDQEALVREAARTMRSGGRMILVTPNASGFHVHWARLRELRHGRRRPREWYHITQSHTRELRWRELRTLFAPWFILRHAETLGTPGSTRGIAGIIGRLLRLPGMHRFSLVHVVEFERRPR